MAKHIPRVYCSNLSHNFKLQDNKAHHLITVLRMNIKDRFIGFNETEGEWICQIDEIDKYSVFASIISRTKLPPNIIKIGLAFCLIKQDNIKLIIEKCSELGVTDFYPLISKYTQYKSININKLQNISESAVEQSERFKIPIIHNISKLSFFLNNLPKEFIWYSAIERTNLSSNFNNKDIGFIIGPEGGFSDQEKLELTKKTIPISFSNYILRSETACICSISKIIN